ncbi:hypothetical protein N7507_004382 [Penicillium longicatenatum]|nr:hypothetical protein N7507_004382 [Penicillium longicatenatum]
MATSHKWDRYKSDAYDFCLFGTVFLVEESEHKWIWVVSPGLGITRSISTHAGGLEIHPEPAGFTERTTTMWPKYQPDPIGMLTPRKFFPENNFIGYTTIV